MKADLVDAGVDLLMAGRTSEALTLADRQIAGAPGDVGAMVLRATCLLVLGRTAEGIAGWRAVATLAPTDPDVVHLGVRCAWEQDAPDLTDRVRLLRQMEGDSPRALHWAALAAARENRPDEVERILALQRRHGPADDGIAHRTAVGSLLLLNARRGRRRRTEQAGEIVGQMLALDPGDQHAHRLRQAVTEVQLRRRPRDRRLHLRALAEIREAAAAGVFPEPGQQRFLVTGAIGAGTLAVIWPLAVLVGAPFAQAGAVPPIVLVVIATGVWAGALYAIDRRARAVARLVPAHSRRRALRPIVLTMQITALAFAVLAVIGLLVLAPYDLARATELGFATDGPRTVETVTYVDLTVPPGPSLPPLRDGNGRPFPTVGRPATVPTRVPVIETRHLPASTDPAEAIRLMRYYAAACLASIGMAGALALWSIQHTTERHPR